MAEKGCQLYIAAEGAQAVLFQHEFPGIQILPLKGYRIHYTGKKESFGVKIAAQVPKILQTIRQEQSWLKKQISLHRFDAVISDNRFGLYSNEVPSVFISHQLAIKSGMGNWVDRFLADQNKKYISRFKYCWIPDIKEGSSLAGELSHPKTIPANARYIGWLSKAVNKIAKNEYDIACILSGPEPQRTLLEQKIVEQLASFNGKAVIVRGLPGRDDTPDPAIPQLSNIQIHNHLASAGLDDVIQKSKLVICRSGYSSVMDMLKLQQRAVFVPTPGQAEQEYLSRHLEKEGIFPSMLQHEFSLNHALVTAEKFPYHFPAYKEEYKSAIDDLINSL